MKQVKRRRAAAGETRRQSPEEEGERMVSVSRRASVISPKGKTCFAPRGTFKLMMLREAPGLLST